MSNYEAINNVRRKINEVLKKTDERITVGWRPPSETKREEGEVWTDIHGKTWTIKNGITQTVTKLDGAKTPLFCPVCEVVMSHRLDTKFWRIRGKCFSCVVKEETEMRRTGEWKRYEEERVKQNFISDLKDKIQELTDLRNSITNPEFIHADDTKILMIERWNVDIEKIKEHISNDIDILEGVLAHHTAEN